MACIVPHEKPFNFGRFYEDAAKNLPSFAMPVFVRLADSLDLTGMLLQLWWVDPPWCFECFFKQCFS